MGQKKQKAKIARYPSRKTLWSYWMQSIEPKSKAISTAFPGHHPLWVIQSQKATVNRENFIRLRKTLLGLNQVQAAAYLRIGVARLRAWERGYLKIPFMAFELLRMVHQSTAFRLSHAQWDGWFIDSDGKFVSPDVGKLQITPPDFAALQYIVGERDCLRTANKTQRDELSALIQENARLRESSVSPQVIDEIASIRDSLDAFVKRASADRPVVVKLPTPSRQVAKLLSLIGSPTAA